MLLSNFLYRDKIKELGYDTIFLEKPVSTIVDFDYRKILSAPPSNLDASVIKELKIVSYESTHRTQADIDLVYLIDTEIESLFKNITDSHNLLYPQRFINLFYDIVFPILLNVKGYWNRARPAQLAKYYGIDISVIVTNSINTPSYPSGHVVYSSLIGSILKTMYPSLTKQFDQVVLDTAKARIIQGVHFPSDNKASLQFVDFVFTKLYPVLRKYNNDQI